MTSREQKQKQEARKAESIEEGSVAGSVPIHLMAKQETRNITPDTIHNRQFYLAAS